MNTYTIYEADPPTQTRGIAVEEGSEYGRGLRYVARVEAEPYWEFSPTSTGFDSCRNHEYIKTGLTWPYHKALVVH